MNYPLGLVFDRTVAAALSSGLSSIMLLNTPSLSFVVCLLICMMIRCFANITPSMLPSIFMNLTELPPLFPLLILDLVTSLESLI